MKSLSLLKPHFLKIPSIPKIAEMAETLENGQFWQQSLSLKKAWLLELELVSDSFHKSKYLPTFWDLDPMGIRFVFQTAILIINSF